MRKKFLYGSAIAALALSVGLVVWQGSFNLRDFGPSDPTQTFVYWAISSLIFLLMVTLGFILFRTGVKLIIERRSRREGSRIKTKLVIGALVLSSVPVFFLFLFSYSVMNRNLTIWFTKPAQSELRSYNEIARALRQEVSDEAQIQAALLAAQPEIQRLLHGEARTPGFLERFTRQQDLIAAAVLSPDGSRVLDAYGPYPLEPSRDSQTVSARRPVMEPAGLAGYVFIASAVPLNIAQRQAEIDRYNRAYMQLTSHRGQLWKLNLSMMALITLFVVFLATWIALFLAKQISTPIEALVHAAGEVRKGNLKYRVDVRAVDELGGLVRGFNAMTQELEANSRELDQRRRFTEAILESIPTGVISIAADGSIKRVNRALQKIFSAEQVARATRLEDLFSRDDTAELKYLMKRARRTGAASRQFELHAGNQTLHLAVTVSALEEKLTSGFVIVLEDTSDLLRAQKAAAWNEVARRVAHEIKNPLTPIALSAERIQRQVDRVSLPPDTRRIVNECSDIIARSLESVKTLVDEFSQFARFPAAQPVRSDINEVVESALQVFRGRLDGIEMRVHLAPALPPVNLDREQFTRVVVNLVDNAAEAMQDTPVRQIDIVTQAGPADSIELIIADTGCGISAEEKEKLFLPYFSTKGRGTGLGLAIVNHILSDHQAHIRVEDNAPSGARFTIEIPALVEADAARV